MVNVKSEVISSRFIETVCSRLADNKQVRRTLPGWGRLHIDRQLPFLCIYRQLNKDDNSLSERLVVGEASYLIASGNRQQQKQISLLVKNIAQTLKKVFGSFLIIEIWISSKEEDYIALPLYKPVFKISRSKKNDISSTIEAFERTLKEIKIRKESAEVEVVTTEKISPAGLSSILSRSEAKQFGCHIIGVEIRPIYQNATTLQDFPMIRREFQRKFARALKSSFFEFACNNTTHHPLHYQALGRRSMVKAVWDVDQQLADISNSFDFLLLVSPINSRAAWASFQRNRYLKPPALVYRPLPIDPAISKRQLFKVPIERIEDPTIARLFREQQLELDRKFTMLIDRGTQRFKYGSFQLYGTVEDSILKLALQMLEQLPPRSREESTGKFVDAKVFAQKAMQELDYFRKTFPESKSKVIIRDDISGLLVSRGNLLIPSSLKIPTMRMSALIQHEVGTHILTYLNGQAQPFRQLYVGLAGYDELQEGLAVLSEYLVGGLTRPRLRMLAARVVAAQQLINGASFVDVFRELNKVHEFERRTAFNITLRTFRSGGLTKDAIYLRGFVKLLEYIKEGGELEPLYIGKFSAEHVSIINELKLRKVLQPAPLLPRYLEEPESISKLNGLRNGLDIINLIKRRKK